MDPEQIIGQLIGGFFGGKQARRRGGFGLPGLGGGGYGYGRKGSGLLNAGTLLTVGGLIWGAIETMQQGSGAGSTPPAPVPPAPPYTPPSADASARGVMSGSQGLTTPPPLPPIPGAASSAAATGLAVPAPPALVPLVQLAVSAARADGELSNEEVAIIRSRASELGAAALVDAELQARRPIDTIAAAFTTPEQRQLAYALAWAVVRGEAEVSPGERMYLTQLSRLLALTSEDVERIERETLTGGSEG